MLNTSIALIYFFYGLAFFSMGLAVTLELGRGSDPRLRQALRPLAGFGILHGLHEWVEMFQALRILPWQAVAPLGWTALRMALLAFSFLSLAAFGASLLTRGERSLRISMLVPLGMAAIWGFGALVARGQFSPEVQLWDVINVWTRYSLAMPSAGLACAGLIAQQRTFRRAGMARFGQDSLWAAVAFLWYGLVGQGFVKPSPLPPSTIINEDLFVQIFGFPIQLLRATVATVASFFVIRFLRAFEVETQRQIAMLQSERLKESQRREALRGALLRRATTAQEAERQRIARELHDETGQSLTALGLGLRAAQGRLEDDPQSAARTLHQLERMTADTLDELQRIISGLRPSHLDDLGLAAALRWYCGEVEERVPIKVHFEVNGDGRELPSEVTTGIFRVAQEALTNVVKHASAENAWVTLFYDADEIFLTVKDDGVGFQSEMLTNPNRPSWGLMGMEERASDLGGSLMVESNPEEGTRVQVIIPYPPGLGGPDE
ncbi:MAG: sensor histidine kinase [Anaerolineales bacterium]